MADFKPVPPLKFWTQAILPLVYDDSLSYQELLGKVVAYLNQISENVNDLPDYIQQLIEQYISSGEIEGILNQILSGYIINVKNPPNNLTPAVGDGTVDDTEAIQGCIDYANSLPYGALVWFPSGAYLSGSLTIKTNVCIGGSSPETTKIVARGGITQPFISGTASNISFTNIMLDGNMDIQVNNVNLITLNVENARFENVYATDGYTLFDVACSNGKCNFINVHCGSAVIRAFNLSGNGAFRLDNIDIDSVSTLNGVDAIACASNDAIINANIYAAVPTGISLTGNNCIVNAYVPNAAQKVTFNENNHNIKISNEILYTNSAFAVEQFGNYQATVTNEYDISIGGNANTEIAGSRRLNVDGANSENISQNDTKIINGTSSLRSVGMRTEQYDDGMEETITGSKRTNVTVDIEHSAGRYFNVTATESAHIYGVSGVEVEGEDVILSPTNPLTYKQPQKLNDFFDYIQFKYGSDVYNVLVAGENINDLTVGTVRDIKEFGAVGDGVTDDTTAVTNFINAVANGNGIGFISPGNYKISSSVSVNNAKSLILIGAGQDVSIFTGNGTTSTIYLSNLDSGFFANFTINGASEDYTQQGNNVGLNIQNSDNVILFKLKFTNCNNYGGWIISGTDSITCHNCKILNCYAYNCFSGLQLQGAENCLMDGCISENNANSGCNFKTPITTSQMSNCTTKNAINNGCTIGSSFTDEKVTYCTFINLINYNVGCGFTTEHCVHCTWDNIIVYASDTDGTGRGVMINGDSHDNVISNISIYNARSNDGAIRFSQTAHNNIVVAMAIKGNGTYSPVVFNDTCINNTAIIPDNTEYSLKAPYSGNSPGINTVNFNSNRKTITVDVSGDIVIPVRCTGNYLLAPTAALNVDNISALYDGDIITLKVNRNDRAVTFTNSGNILPNADCILNSSNNIVGFMYVESIAKWVEIFRAFNT